MDIHMIFGSHGGIGKTNLALILGAGLRHPQKGLLMLDLNYTTPRLFELLGHLKRTKKRKTLQANRGNYLYLKVPYLQQYAIRPEPFSDLAKGSEEILKIIVDVVHAADCSYPKPPHTCIVDTPFSISNLKHQKKILEFPEEFKRWRVVTWFLVDLVELGMAAAKDIQRSMNILKSQLPYFSFENDFKLIVQPSVLSSSLFNELYHFRTDIGGMTYDKYCKLFSLIAQKKERGHPQKELEKEILSVISGEISTTGKRPINVLPLKKIAECNINQVLEKTSIRPKNDWEAYLKPAVNELKLFS